MQSEKIKVNRIRVPDKLLRELGDPEFIERLAASIRRHTLLQPIIVRKVERGFYELIAGLRRLEATKSLGRITISARVVEYGDQDALETAFAENFLKEEMTALETAYAYHELVNVYKIPASKLVKIGLAKTQGTVRRYLRLVDEPEAIQAMLKTSEEGEPPVMTEYQVRMSKSDKLSDEERVRVLDKAVREGLTGSQIGQVVDAAEQAFDGDRRDKLILDIPFSSSVHDGHNELQRTLREQEKAAKPKVKPPEEEPEEKITDEERLLAAIELCEFEEEEGEEVLKNRLHMIDELLKGISLE